MQALPVMNTIFYLRLCCKIKKQRILDKRAKVNKIKSFADKFICERNLKFETVA